MLQRLMEQAGRLLPRTKRYPTERWIRGWLESKRLAFADFVIVSFGKSGRTWLRVLISRLYQQQYGLPEGSLIEFGNFHRAHDAIPRILFTHDNYLRDYTGDGGSKVAYAGKRVVLLVRHPADITVSQYFQWKHRMREHKIALNDYPSRASDPTLFQFTTGSSGLPKVNDWLNEWAAALDRIPHHLIVSYEELRRDTLGTFAKVAEFLGAHATPEQLADAVEWAKFENMKQRETESASESGRLKAGDVDNPDSFKTRRAKAGGYRDDFAEAELATIEHAIETSLDPRFGYSAQTRRQEVAQ
jgi:sulfotransferase family protein